MQFPLTESFKLSDNFIEKYKEIKPNFGFNGLGELVFLRTYSRLKDDGTNEQWWEVCKRVVEGIYSIQKQHIIDYNLGWNQMKAQKSAQEMYERLFELKFSPGGRSLWAMGADVIMKKGLIAALFNCSFISSDEIAEDPGLFFSNIMDFLMCGVGVGIDLLGANKAIIKDPKKGETYFIIPDSREGWVQSLELLVNSFFGGHEITFDYSSIRPEGDPIKTFGGTSSGFLPLQELHKAVRRILLANIGNKLSARHIADITNLIGKAVVAGNVRRSSEILLDYPSEEFLDLKDYTKNPDRVDFGWNSNNSVIAKVGMDYSDIAERIKTQAEPGIFWLENAQAYSRMREDEKDYKDSRVKGLNP